MKKYHIFLLLTLAVLMTACTATPMEIAECAQGEPAGFWLGAWHGIIAPFTFVLSLFTDNIDMYATYNNGGWYDFGFVLGAGILFGGSGSGAKRRRKKDR